MFAFSLKTIVCLFVKVLMVKYNIPCMMWQENCYIKVRHTIKREMYYIYQEVFTFSRPKIQRVIKL